VAAAVVISCGSALTWHWLGATVEGTLWAIIGPSFTIMAVLGKWTRGSHDDAGGNDDGIDGLADTLAVAVAKEWKRETQIRNLENPKGIALTWKNADNQATARWETIRREPRVNRRIDLSGRLSEDKTFSTEDITALFDRLPSGRLVVLGAPGAGKTVIALKLVTFIATSRKDGSLAVLLPLASWNCEKLSFLEWAVECLAQSYPKPMACAGKERAKELLESGRVVFILDGLDELPPELRSETIQQLNQQLSSDIRVVLTCRSTEYEQTGYVLNEAAVVEIQPLDQPTICRYLELATQSPRDSQKWESLLAELERDPACPLAQALDTPLMLWLARTVYIGTAAKPNILISTRPDGEKLFPTPDSIRNHLLDRVIPAEYAKIMVDGAKRLRYSGKNAERWLTFLAVQLEQLNSYDLAVWRLHRSMNRIAKYLVCCCVFGVIIGISGALLYSSKFGLSFGIITGLSAGTAAAYAGPAEPPYGTEGNEPLLKKYKSGIFFIISLWCASGLATTLSLGLISGISVWCWEALAAAVAGTLAFFLSKVIDTRNEQLSSPATILALSLKVTLVWASLFAALLFLGMDLSKGIHAALVAGLIGALGVVFANAWGGLIVTRGYFALTRRLPWRLMSFLADGHKRGILRQMGAVYQFRHAAIQDRLVYLAYERKNKRAKTQAALIARFRPHLGLPRSRRPGAPDANL
jgi:NACHT domain